MARSEPSRAVASADLKEVSSRRPVSTGKAARSLGWMRAVGAPAVAPTGAADMTKKLKEAKELLDCGAISDVEFETIKARYLNNM